MNIYNRPIYHLGEQVYGQGLPQIDETTHDDQILMM